jgi:hypothetical protein
MTPTWVGGYRITAIRSNRDYLLVRHMLRKRNLKVHHAVHPTQILLLSMGGY